MKTIARLATLATLSLATALPALAADQNPGVTVDTHVDIPFTFMAESRFDVGKNTPLQVDLGKMEKGGLNSVFFVIWVPQGPLNAEGYAKAVAQANQKYDGIGRMLMQYPDRIRLATTAGQVRANHKAGLLSAMIGIENSYSLGHDIKRLDAAFDRGARYVGLVHVHNNDLCSSSMPDTDKGEPAMNSAGDTGMTDFGRAVVKRANELGIMVDVSHASDRCTSQAVKLSTAPVIASHSGARAIADHPRNLTDALIREIAAKGGVIQAVAYTGYVKLDPARDAAGKAMEAALTKQHGDKKNASDDYAKDQLAARAELDLKHPMASVNDYVDHIQHIVKIAGIDHVGIASDFDGGGGIGGWNTAEDTRNVTAGLRARGFSDADIAKIWGGNLLRVWSEVERKAAPAAP